ncbi:YopX family protein [Streptococcus salivarius]|uniref:YopX family protein n=1 Tax=Streptococcus salivarius TaxID=1304 RepID=UPI002152A097|nr:YopX family protein [Streptococcus salivarius]
MIPRYRAWLKEDKEMIDVDEMHFKNGELDFIGNGITWMYKKSDIVLMQSTGFKDKNGKEIFEGDIVDSEDGILSGVVELRPDLGMWTNSLLRYNNFERLCCIANSREIIGNIWENGELLDGENTEEN